MAPRLIIFIAILSASSALNKRAPDCPEGEIYVVHHGCVPPTSQEQQRSKCPEGTGYSKLISHCKVDGDAQIRKAREIDDSQIQKAHEIDIEQRIKRSNRFLNDLPCKQGYILTEAGCVNSTKTKPQLALDYEDRMGSYGCSDGEVKAENGCVKVSHVHKPESEPDEFDDRINNYGCPDGEMRSETGCVVASNATKSIDEPDYEE